VQQLADMAMTGDVGQEFLAQQLADRCAGPGNDGFHLVCFIGGSGSTRSWNWMMAKF